MQRRNPGATSALLQKATSQLKGEKIEKPEDELNAYISSLTQKTSKQKSVNFEDIGESLSISSDIEDAPIQPKPELVSSSASKFLKKKPAEATQDSGRAPATSSFVKKPQGVTAGSAQSKTPQSRGYGSSNAGMQSSGRPTSQASTGRQGQVMSALDKASALTGKIQQRAATRRVMTLESDSDESFSAMKMPRTTISDQMSDQSLTSESVKIGRDGGKFLKKATPAPKPGSPKMSSEPPLTSVTVAGRNKSPNKQNKQAPAGPAQKKASPFALKSSMKYSTDVVLTSEEESLAEFVGGLPSSSGDSFEKPKRQVVGKTGMRHSPSPSPPPNWQGGRGRRSPSPPARVKSGRTSSQPRSPSPQYRPPVIRKTPSPSPRASNGRTPSPNLRRRSPSPKLMRSYSDDSNVAESIKSEIAEDFDLGMNIIMDLDDLGPAADDLPDVHESRSSRSDVRSTARKSKRDKKPNKSSLKSGSGVSFKDDSGSPFKASKEPTESPFKASSKSKDVSPFHSGSQKSQSPFKASKESQSPFKASKEKSSPFNANNKENRSPFSATSNKNDSPFKTKTSSPFRASNEESIFKSSKKTSSPFRAGSRADDSSRSERSSSPFKSKSSKTKKDKKERKSKQKEKTKSKKDKNKASSDVFSAFGLQTVEDLLGMSAKESEYETVVSEGDEIGSDVTEEIKTEKPGGYSYSDRFEDSATEIPSEVEGTTRPSAPSYTDDFDDASVISERIGYASDRGRSSASEVKTRFSGEETVTSYTEFSESDTETITRSRSSDFTRSYSYEESTYTDDYEDYTKSLVPTSRSDLTPLPPRGMSTAGVQTSVEGLQYSWDPRGSGMAFPGIPYGLGFVDPTPIATQVVSADALEAMTSYSPAMLALHDMLKAQYDLTCDFLNSQKQMHADFSNSIKSTYNYTTLKDTKQYIKKHRKKRMTFKEALRLVDREMARQSH